MQYGRADVEAARARLRETWTALLAQVDAIDPASLLVFTDRLKKVTHAPGVAACKAELQALAAALPGEWCQLLAVSAALALAEVSMRGFDKAAAEVN